MAPFTNTISKVIEIENLSHFYGKGKLKKQILFDLNLTLNAGEVVILRGPSGSGKTTVRLDLGNAPQLDAVLMIEGGQSGISVDDYIEGAPELVLEIAASSVAYDLYDKKRAYRRNGVKEYLVWRVQDNEFDWFCLENGEYIKLEANEEGIICSRVFPGLWLAVDSLLSGEMEKVLALGQQGHSFPAFSRRGTCRVKVLPR